MLLPTIANAALRQARQRQAIDRYAAWTAAIVRLRQDCEAAPVESLSRLRQYWESLPAAHQAEAAQDLIAEHLRLAWSAGYGAPLEAYLDLFGGEFPELAGPAAVPVDLVEDEFLVRYSSPWGDAPDLESYLRRFPDRIDVGERLGGRVFGGGRYIRLERLGSGAMGEVFKAHDRELGRLVAIKRPRQDLLDDVHVLARFALEARLTAALEHPAIISVHEHNQRNQVPFYVMRLALGQSLSEVILDYHQPPADRTGGQQRLLWRRLIEVLATVCDAAAYAHSQRIVHRDLKPANVVVGSFGETAVVDWGMACKLTHHCSTTPQAPLLSSHERAEPRELTGDGAALLVAGTPQYMPPEQADGVCDPRSDVFGLGAILYEIMTGRPPHHWPTGCAPPDWLARVRQPSFTPPRRLNGFCPKSLEAVCLKALAVSPTDRYASALELAADLRRYLAGEGVSAIPAGPWRRLRSALGQG